MSVTIDDVAKAAGVHPATVSRALRGVPGKVSPAKRAEIEALARSLGYQPNIIASSLRTKRTNIAAILVPDLANPMFAPLVKGLELELRTAQVAASCSSASASSALVPSGRWPAVASREEGMLDMRRKIGVKRSG